MEKKEKESAYAEKSKLPEVKPAQKTMDAGFWIALVAIIISVATAFISLYEANLMKNQQHIMMEQKNASAWPYIQISPFYTYNSKKDRVTAEFTLKNKGVGPAILGDVKYLFEGKEVETYSFVDEFQANYPDYDIQYLNNQQLDHFVISAGEEISFLGFYITDLKNKSSEISNLLNNLDSEISFCYCSIYKDCWKYEKHKQGEYDRCE